MTASPPSPSTDSAAAAGAVSVGGGPSFDVLAIRQDFPILHQAVYGKPLVYLDNAATTQKPRAVIEAIVHHLTHDNANVHRGVHALSQRATAAFDAVREAVKNFIHARDEREIVFVRGVTEAINLVARTWGKANLRAGDEIILSGMEHHADIVPWQMLAQEIGFSIRTIPFDDRGELQLDVYDTLLSERTQFVGIVHVSNALGTINPVQSIIDKAHAVGAKVLVDGAQATLHTPIDVQTLDCDFYAISAHKMCGPSGIGALYAKGEILDAMPPFLGGGDMIASVSWDGTSYAAPPARFEAGTPNIEGVIGFGAAIAYLSRLGIEAIAAYEQTLLAAATERVADIAGLRIIGTAARKSSVMSFVMDDAHPHDIGAILDREGVAIRAGHHCAEPLMRALKLTATARASFAFYNTMDEVDAFVRGLRAVKRIFG